MLDRSGLTAVALLAAALGIWSDAAARDRPVAEAIYTGGPILTMEGATPARVEALSVAGGHILAMGTLSEVRKDADRTTHTIDLRGRALLPGFIDAHGHVSGVGQAAGLAQLSSPPVGKVTSIAELQNALRDYIAAHNIPPGGVVAGIGYDDSRLAEHRHPDRHDLDAVATDRLIVLVHTSGHFSAYNTAALTKLGVTADRPNPAGGVIRREADGRTPDGVLEETASTAALMSAMHPSLDAGVAALVAGEKIYAANGITTAQDGREMPNDYAVAIEAARRGVLPIDTVGLIAFEKDWPEAVTGTIGAAYQGRFRVAGVKLVVDGSPQGRTAWLHDPVPVPPAGHDASYSGYPAIRIEDFRRQLTQAAQHGWPVFAHVNGDEAMQALIDGVEATGLAGKRTIAIHAQVVRVEQLEAMKRLDIQPSFFASHTWYWGDWHREVSLGPRRADFISPQRTAQRLGLVASAHNDSPVAPPDMMRLIWSSVNRRTLSGDILGPSERISPYDALRQVTFNAAWQIHEDEQKGSLKPGKLADLVVLDRDPLAVDPAALADLKVVATLKDGKVIFGAVD